MNVQRIVALLVIFLIVYLVYNYFSNSDKTKLTGINDAKKEITISSNAVKSGNTDNYTYSIWLNIDDWDYRYGEKKVVFGKATSNGPSPSLYLDGTLNDLIVKVGTTETRVTNVPLQAWFNVIVALNARVLDVYLDGKLVRTQLLDAVPKSTTAPLHLTPEGGFSGKTARFEHISYAVNPTEAYDIYRDGSGTGSLLGSLFNKYRLKIAFMEDNTETTSFEI